MRTGEFTQEEITYLRSLRAVARVSNGRIRYTEEFKRECMRRYAAGESPARIFRDAGLDSALIGYKRIERCISRWRGIEAEADNTSPNKSGVNGGNGTADGHHDRSDDDYADEAFSPHLVVRSGRRDLRDLLIAQQVRRIAELEREVTELKAEAEFTIDHGDSAADEDGVAGALGNNGVVSEIGETTDHISRGGLRCPIAIGIRSTPLRNRLGGMRSVVGCRAFGGMRSEPAGSRPWMVLGSGRRSESSGVRERGTIYGGVAKRTSIACSGSAVCVRS